MTAKKLVKPVGIALLSFFVAAVLTSPKVGMFYKLQHTLYDKKIEITNKKATNMFLYLALNDLKLNAFSNKILESENSCFYSSYIYSGFYIDSPKLSDAAQALLPVKIDSIYASTTIFTPSKIYLKLSGDFGKIKATIDTSTGTFKAILKLSKEYESGKEHQSTKNTLMIKFKETEEGLVYESAI
jgi:hypothetical protein